MSLEYAAPSTFLVERYWPDVTWDEMRAGAQRLVESTLGGPVRYVRSTLVPEDGIVYCEFEAPSAHDVAAVNVRAGVRFDRIVSTARVFDEATTVLDALLNAMNRSRGTV